MFGTNVCQCNNGSPARLVRCRNTAATTPRPHNVRIRACTAACGRGRRDRRGNVRYRYRTASVVIKGHAFIQNVRRGHYELGTETTPNSESRPHSTYSSQRSDERGRRPPGLFSI